MYLFARGGAQNDFPLISRLTNIGMPADSCGWTRRKVNTSIPKSLAEEGFLLGRPGAWVKVSRISDPIRSFG
jgi:hypothetical protein